MYKKIAIFSLKVSLAGLLLYPLANKGLLSLPDFSGVDQLALFGFGYVVLFVCNYFLNALRFKLLIPAQTLRYSKVLFFTAIGNFFNSVLPGFISGDVVKLYYVQKNIPNYSKKTLLFLIFLDRLAGLSGLIILANFALLLSVLFGNLIAITLALPVVFLLLGLLLFYGGLFVARNFWAKHVPYLQCLLAELNWGKLFVANLQAMFISLLVFALQMVILYTYTLFLSPTTLDFWQLVPALSLGLVVVALPITPLGIGVGHISFQVLMSQIGFEQGANLYTLFFLLQALVNCPGVVCYLWGDSARKLNQP